MTQAQVLLLIQQNIVQNNNEEITADVLRPILEEMLNQPNILIGDLDDLGTVDQTTIVAAINELLAEINSATGVVIHYGTGTPDVTPPASFDLTDYYVQQAGTITLGMWQWNGADWVKIENVSSQAVLTIPQILTNAQKEQARKNIGANSSVYDTAETGFSTDLSNFTSLTGKFYFLRVSGEGDTVYFASKETNTEDFVGSRIYVSETGTKHDLGQPTVTQNGYHFWDIGVLPVTINPSSGDFAFQFWIKSGGDGVVKGVSDESLYLDPNTGLLRANVSTFAEQWTFTTGDPQTKTLAFEPTNFIGVSVNGQEKYADEYIYVSPDQFTFNDDLENGDRVRIIYEHLITQP